MAFAIQWLVLSVRQWSDGNGMAEKAGRLVLSESIDRSNGNRLGECEWEMVFLKQRGTNGNRLAFSSERLVLSVRQRGDGDRLAVYPECMVLPGRRKRKHGDRLEAGRKQLVLPAVKWSHGGKYIGDYYVNGSGVWVQGHWVQSGNRWWYANPDGTYPKNGWKTIQSKEYYFDKDGWMVTGWLKIGSTWYYLNPSGERAYDQWVGTPKAIGSCYISKYGKAVTGTTYSLGDYIYTFDANGYCTKKENRYSYATDSKNGKTYKVEKQYDTDASNMSENDFLAAAVYAESANQGLTGMTGVAMVMLNRMANAAYPSDARIMIYQASQFEVARDGALTKAIAKLNSSETAMQNAKEAVRKAREIRAAYQKDGTVTPIEGLNVPAGHTIFEYLGFMTPAAFQSSNLDPVKTAMFTYKNTAFYTSWIKKS